jgi:hypothetical protein
MSNAIFLNRVLMLIAVAIAAVVIWYLFDVVLIALGALILSLAARAPAAQPDHFRIGRGLVDEHQSGRIKHGLPSLPASTCPGHVRAILLRGAQAFF